MITSLVFLLGAGIAAPEPANHSLYITQDTPCGTCTVSNRADALAFEIADGRLGLFADFPAGENSVAILEVIGIDLGSALPEIHYHEVENGKIVFKGHITRPSFALRRIAPDRALVVGTMSFDVVASNGEMRVFREIRVVPPEQVSGTDPHGGGGSGAVVVVHDHNYVNDYGCGGGSRYESDGGCEGDTSSSDTGCEGDSSYADSGCEGDSGSAGSGCSGSDSCEGDYAASQSAMIGSLWRLCWPIFTVGAWNRRQRNKKR